MDAAFFVTQTGRIRRSGLVRSETAPHRDPNPKYIVGVKFEVVRDVVPVSFGADKEAPPDSVADAYSRMKKEMVAVESTVAAASRYCAAAELIVKNQGLAADPGHEIAARLTRQLASKHSIDVVENWAIRLEVVVVGLVVPERALDIQPEMIIKNVFGAGAGIHPALYGWRQKSNGRCRILRRPKSVAADSDVHLLSTCEAGG